MLSSEIAVTIATCCWLASAGLLLFTPEAWALYRVLISVWVAFVAKATLTHEMEVNRPPMKSSKSNTKISVATKIFFEASSL